MAPLVFGQDQYTAIGIGIDSSTGKCGAYAEVPWASYQLQHTVLVCQAGEEKT